MSCGDADETPVDPARIDVLFARLDGPRVGLADIEWDIIDVLRNRPRITWCTAQLRMLELLVSKYTSAQDATKTL